MDKLNQSISLDSSKDSELTKQNVGAIVADPCNGLRRLRSGDVSRFPRPKTWVAFLISFTPIKIMPVYRLCRAAVTESHHPLILQPVSWRSAGRRTPIWMLASAATCRRCSPNGMTVQFPRLILSFHTLLCKSCTLFNVSLPRNSRLEDPPQIGPHEGEAHRHLQWIEWTSVLESRIDRYRDTGFE